MRAFNIGSRWCVTEGSGLASGKLVVVVPWHNWRAIPGMYKAPNSMREVAIRFEDTGEIGFMFKTRLIQVDYAQQRRRERR